MFLVEQKKSCFKSLIKVGSKLIKYQLHNCNVVLMYGQMKTNGKRDP